MPYLESDDDNENSGEGDLGKVKQSIVKMLQLNMDKNTIALLLNVEISLVEKILLEINKN